VVVMRHSVRLDDAVDGALWDDAGARPYDPPISDAALPGAACAALAHLRIGAVACSPFRRCVETAGHVARALGVCAVVRDARLGELMHRVRACGGAGPLSYRSDADVDAALGPGVARGGPTRGRAPNWDEAPGDGARRFLSALASLRAEFGRLVVVTHGDLVAAAAEAGAGLVAYEVAPCGYVTLGPNGALAARAGVAALGDGVGAGAGA